MIMARCEYLVCPVCVAEGTRVVYDNYTTKKIEEIVIGDRLNDSIVLNTHSRQYDGYAIKIKPMYLNEIILTPEHKVLVRIGKDNNRKRQLTDEITWKSASELTQAKQKHTTDYLLLPKFKEFKKTYVDFWSYVKNKNKSSDRTKNLYNKPFEVTEELAELCGWYCAEGFLCKESVWFSLGEKETENIKRIQEIAIKLGFVTKTQVKKTTPKATAVNVIVPSRVLGRMLVDHIGKGAENKKIPEFIFNARPSVINSFIEAYFKGDGCRHGKVSIVNSVSKDLILQLQLLLSKMGILSYMGQQKGNCSIQGRKVNARMRYNLAYYKMENMCNRFFQDKNYYYIPIRKIEVIKYSGKVYDLQTTNSMFYVPFIIHNCGFNRSMTKYDGNDRIFDTDLDTKLILQVRHGGGRGSGFTMDVDQSLTIHQMIESMDKEYLRILRKLAASCRRAADYIEDRLVEEK
jgi:intein/homing endonuclease